MQVEILPRQSRQNRLPPVGVSLAPCTSRSIPTTGVSTHTGARWHPIHGRPDVGYPFIQPIGLIETFVNEPFSGDERHVRRIGKIAEYETTGTYSER